VARDMESAYRTPLCKGEVGILERSAVPTLKEFSQRFVDEIQVRCAAKPNTVAFYAMKLTRLLEFEPLASARLDSIDESLIAAFVQRRSAQQSRARVNRKKKREPKAERLISPASVNRELAMHFEPCPGALVSRIGRATT
jgi:hypothetical protein